TTAPRTKGTASRLNRLNIGSSPFRREAFLRTRASVAVGDGDAGVCRILLAGRAKFDAGQPASRLSGLAVAGGSAPVVRNLGAERPRSAKAWRAAARSSRSDRAGTRARAVVEEVARPPSAPVARALSTRRSASTGS